jgi:hypothetical protein
VERRLGRYSCLMQSRAYLRIRHSHWGRMGASSVPRMMGDREYRKWVAPRGGMKAWMMSNHSSMVDLANSFVHAELQPMLVAVVRASFLNLPTWPPGEYTSMKPSKANIASVKRHDERQRALSFRSRSSGMRMRTNETNRPRHSVMVRYLMP